MVVGGSSSLSLSFTDPVCNVRGGEGRIFSSEFATNSSRRVEEKNHSAERRQTSQRHSFSVVFLCLRN